MRLSRRRPYSAEMNRRWHGIRNPAAFDARRFATRDAWLDRAAALRRRIAFLAGLWPHPTPRTPPTVQSFGRIERDDHTLDCVRFESIPGLWIGASVYRPTRSNERSPTVLHAHGHVPGGRFGWADEAAVAREIAGGAERFESAARSTHQAACVALARAGCVVLALDMIGYGDTIQLEHTSIAPDFAGGFSMLGLQLFNCVRAIDLLESMPEVDGDRIGMIGFSGGGTQAILTTAIDERIRVAGVAGMVSSSMQGGCVCENAPLLRVGTNNVELMALAAPRPTIVLSANDWTQRFEADDRPQLSHIFGLFDATAKFESIHIDAGHNFNRHTRQAICRFVVSQLGLDADTAEDRDFVPVRPEEIRIDSPMPAVEVPAIQSAWQSFASPTAARQAEWASAVELICGFDSPVDCDFIVETPADWNGDFVLLFAGHDPAIARTIRDRGTATAVVRTDDADPPADVKFAGETLCYNRSRAAELACRMVCAARRIARREGVRRVRLFGSSEHASATLVARLILRDDVFDACVDFGGRPFEEASFFGSGRLGGIRAIVAAGVGHSTLITSPPAELIEKPLPPGSVEVRRNEASVEDCLARLVGRRKRAALVDRPEILHEGFIYDDAPFPSCHAATLVESDRGSLLVSFFGGTHERHPDVCIYVCRFDGRRWSPPVAVADGVQVDGSRQPTWNPVLFQPAGGPLMLFYKVGPSPSTWWGEFKTSDDDGRTWSPARRLPDGLLGPIKNKPVQLPGGRIVSPTSVEGKEIGWRVYFELSDDGGTTWRATPWVETGEGIRAIQPSVLIHSATKLQAIGRTKSGRLFETWSDDAGETWSPLALTALPNCNSGTDAVTLADGRHVLIYNHSWTEKERFPLNLAVSTDGRRWFESTEIEGEPPGQYSYPCVIQTRDGRLHAAYTWKRLRMKHVVLDPSHLPMKSEVLGSCAGE